MTTPSSILVAYTYSLNNIGDISNTSGLVHLLNEELPGTPIRVIASQTGDSADYPIVERYYRENKKDTTVLANPFKIHCAPPRFGDDATPWGRFCRRWGAFKMEAFLNGSLVSDLAAAIADDLLTTYSDEVIDHLKINNPEAFEAFAEAAFFLYSSGTLLNFGRLQLRDFWTFALHWALPMMVARRLGIPYGIDAHSFDAIDWPADLVLRPLLKEAAFIYSRDSDSAQYLRQRDLQNKNDGYRPDTSFFFSVRDGDWADRFLAENGLKERQFLVLVTRHPVLRISGDTEWDKVGGDPIAGKISLERQTAQMEKLRAFIEEWIATTGIPVLMGLEARVAKEPMRHWLDRNLSGNAKKGIVWLDTFWASEQAFSIYERARAIISMEMHSIIMGVKAHTPVVHIPFRECGRKARMMHDLRLGDWLLDIDEMSVDDLLCTVRKIDREFEASVERTRQATALADRLGRSVIADVRAAICTPVVA